ncbi:hypothetical protein MJT46_019149 [Ovis ammon polii x Ovis aries]|nr:hypothetical protein MJT46_019149 [Ovis ammon polii x Ovis aries]
MTLKHVHIREVGISPPPTRPPSPTPSTVHSPPNPPTLPASVLLHPPPTRGLQFGSEVSNSGPEIIIKDLWPNPLQYYVKRKAPPQEVLEGQETSFPVLKVNHIGYQKGKVGHSIISFPKSGIRIEMYEWTRAPKAKTRSSMRRRWWTLLLAIVGLPILSLLTFVIAMAVQQFLESLKSGFNDTQGHQP